MKALDALTLEPEGFIDDLRDLSRVCERSITGSGATARAPRMKSAVEQLWHIALRIEDGEPVGRRAGAARTRRSVSPRRSRTAPPTRRSSS